MMRHTSDAHSSRPIEGWQKPVRKCQGGTIPSEAGNGLNRSLGFLRPKTVEQAMCES